MSKNNKEKSSFWKKLGLGKNKTSSVSSLRSDYIEHGKYAEKRSSGATTERFLQHEAPRPTSTTSTVVSASFNGHHHKRYNNDTPPMPSLRKSNSLHHVLHTTSGNSKRVDISHHPTISTPTVATTAVATTAVTTVTMEDEDSTPVIETSSNKQEQPVEEDEEFIVVNNNSSDYKSPVVENNHIKQELEKEKATVLALQKQKEAITKDLDYLATSNDELCIEKNDLVTQLEKEKAQSQHHLDDLNILLVKMKSNADIARDKSLLLDQSKQEFMAYKEESRQEKDSLLQQLIEKNENIINLESKLSKSEEYTKTLKSTMDQLVKVHAEEINRLAADLASATAQTAAAQAAAATATAAAAAAVAAAKEKNSDNNNDSSLQLHTPNGSPKLNQYNEEHMEVEYYQEKSPIPTRIATYKKPTNNKKNNLDAELDELIKRKEELRRAYSKIPIEGDAKSRKRKEELDDELNLVDSKLSKVRQQMRRS